MTRWRATRVSGRRGLAAVAAVVVAVAPLLSPGDAGADSATANGFRLVARLSDNTVGGNGVPRRELLLDPVHRLAYSFEQETNEAIFHRYNIDSIDHAVRTFAGAGAAGFSGDGGPATSAALSGPGGLAFDKIGNLYVADTGNNRIRKIATDGVIATVAGTGSAGFSGDDGPAVEASLNTPRGLAFDKSGNLYIADTGNNRVRKVGADGKIATVAGNGSAGFSGDGGKATDASLNAPRAVAIATDSTVLVADTDNNRVRKINPFGTISTFAGNGEAGFSGDGGPAPSAKLNHPEGVAAGLGQNSSFIYIADTGNHRIRRASMLGGSILTYAGTGAPGFSGDGGKSDAARLNAPTGVFVYTSTGLYVADTGNGRVRTITVATGEANRGTIVTAVGGGAGDGSVPLEAQLDAPRAVAITRDGALYIADEAGNRIRRVGGGMQEVLPAISVRTGQEADSLPMASIVGAIPPMAIDPGTGSTPTRIFYLSSVNRLVHEVEPGTSDRDPADPNHNPTVHTWTAGGSGGANLFVASDFAPNDISYDPGETDPNGVVARPPMLYLAGRVAQATTLGGHRLLIVGMDARHDPAEPPGDKNNPQDRFKWAYSVQTCTVGGGNENLGGTPVARAGEWLYTFCDAYRDRQTKGVVRVKLTTSGEPDPTTEEFFPGVTGSFHRTSVDTLTERVYTATTTGVGRDVLVFDGRAAGGLGAYTGLISLSQTADNNSFAGLDPATGRWYFQSREGLWYQDGRLRRVAQANRFTTATNDYDGVGATQGLEDFRPVEPTPIVVDPAVLGAGGAVLRPARIYVYRGTSEQPMCPVAGLGCWEVYEDASPLPGTPPPPSEATLNVPEGEGLAGVYNGVASAYGARIQVMRGLSTLWPSGVPVVAGLVDTPLESAPNPNAPTSFFTTDPFYYHAGSCGSSDREVTFARVRQVQAHGDLFSKIASAEAVGVDPDVIRPSAGTDTQTRDDLKRPDACTVGLMRTMTSPACNLPDQPAFGDGWKQLQKGWGDNCNPNAEAFWNGVGNGLSQAGQEWPYQTVACQGDDSPEAKNGSLQGFAPATAQVKCGATADKPSSEASASSQLTPTTFPVSVEQADASTKIVRDPGHGIETVATSIVKGIDIVGAVHIDQMIVSATSRAKGYCASDLTDCARGLDPKSGTKPQVEYSRKFLGVTVNGTRLCDDETVCDVKQVVDAINLALGSTGYARAADPEPDVTQRTVKGTLGVLQKDQVLQDSDSITNADFATEWPGLQIIIFRDGVQRGWGRWEVQLGGVFSQAQQGVVTELPSVLSGGGGGTDGTPAVPGSSNPGSTIDSTEEVPSRQVLLDDEFETTAASRDGKNAPESLLRRIAEGVERSLKAALLLVALWALVYAPVYVARRREFLREVMSNW